MTQVAPMTDNVTDLVDRLVINAENLQAWNRDERVKGWLAGCRLDAIAAYDAQRAGR